jgi:hypothetical protein
MVSGRKGRKEETCRTRKVTTDASHNIAELSSVNGHGARVPQACSRKLAAHPGRHRPSLTGATSCALLWEYVPPCCCSDIDPRALRPEAEQADTG